MQENCQEYSVECTPITYAEGAHFQNMERFQLIPVDVRLQQNKQRRMVIEKIRQKQRQSVLKKRQEKNDNIERLLRQKAQARNNAKILFDNYHKTHSNNFHTQNSGFKDQDITNKIQDCRMRATQYKQNRQERLKQQTRSKEKRVHKKLKQIQEQELEKINAYHMEQWNQYEKKLLKKHQKDEKRSPRHLYDAFMKREKQIKDIINRYKKKQPKNNSFHQNEKVSTNEKTKTCSKKQLEGQSDVRANVGNISSKNNPITYSGDISTFGMSKSIKNPEKIMKSAIQYLNANKMTQQPEKEDILLQKFQEFLSRNVKL